MNIFMGEYLPPLRGFICYACATCLFYGAAISNAQAEERLYSEAMMGMIGLNTVPSARMDETGTVKLGVSTLDPYINAYLGFQLAAPLSVVIRQSAEISNINEDARRLYPGVDFKLRLLKENRSRPEVALGVQSALGHKRMAGEYLAASKRYKAFDFTAGIGWGRFGTAGHMGNPLKSLSNHFGKNRDLDGEMPNEPEDWFTGENIGFFGGIEYFTPAKGLSLKFDWGADRYEAERAAFNFEPAAPWSVGMSYWPADWANINLGTQGFDKVMGRLTLKAPLQNWRDQAAQADKTAAMRPFRSKDAAPGQMGLAAAEHGLVLYDTRHGKHSAQARIRLKPNLSTPHQIGQAAIHMSNHAGRTVEEVELTPTILGLQGPSVRLIRRDFEQALIRHQGSAQEIWHNAEFGHFKSGTFEKLKRGTEVYAGLMDYHAGLETQLSLAEEDSGTLYRTSALIGARGPSVFGLLDSAFAFRINLKDNLQRLEDLRPRSPLPVRSNVDKFAERTIALDRFYTALTHSFKPGLHAAATAGYLEEMYGGIGGEVLYRPFKKRYAFGAEAWQVFKRDPGSAMHLGFENDHLITGHLNAWYDVPKLDLTLQARLGRYLAEDKGGTLGLQKRFKNGARLEGFVSVTDDADFDLFGGITHAHHGIRLHLPLGGFKYAPENSFVDMKFEPFGRDIGQSLDNPLPLYEVTQPFSASHMISHWEDILP